MATPWGDIDPRPSYAMLDVSQLSKRFRRVLAVHLHNPNGEVRRSKRTRFRFTLSPLSPLVPVSPSQASLNLRNLRIVLRPSRLAMTSDIGLWRLDSGLIALCPAPDQSRQALSRHNPEARNHLIMESGPKARNATAWANGPGKRSSLEFRSAEGAKFQTGPCVDDPRKVTSHCRRFRNTSRGLARLLNCPHVLREF
jgi:hypothetical protein